MGTVIEPLKSTNRLIRLMCDQVRVLRGQRPKRFPWSPMLVKNKRLLIEKRLRNIRELWLKRRAHQQRFKEAA